ncbi:MAG: TolC family protein [Verrucomicrobiota bacterium]|nr:TolC family protein [Limisphaera sp.]MDW8381958.1 TolC family protein [Verrucomicrobiota bacterium]
MSRGAMLRWSLGLGTVLVTAGCVQRVGPSLPALSLPEQFHRSGSHPLPDRWWQSFEDPTLSSLIEGALQHQPGLLAVWARLEQATALARKAGAGLGPEVIVEGRASRSHQRSELSAGQMRDRGSADLMLGLAAAYELDLWGRIRASRDAAIWEARASAEQLQVAALTLSAEIARVWFEWAAQQTSVELWNRQVTLQSNILQLVEARFERGQVGAADVLRQRQVLENACASRAVTLARGRVLQHQLAVLTGRLPGEPLPVPAASLPLPPALPSTGVPAELICRRPDLKAARHGLMAADRRLAAAVADRFPRLSLSAQALTSGNSGRVLLDQWLATLAANVMAPVLDGGVRRAEIAYRRAVVAEHLQVYRQAVLEALAEVETALVREQEFHELWKSLQRQLALADRTVEHLREGYSKGTVDYLRVLDALLTQQGLQRAELEARLNLWLQRIALCRALAGSWELPRPAQAQAAQWPDSGLIGPGEVR